MGPDPPYVSERSHASDLARLAIHSILSTRSASRKNLPPPQWNKPHACHQQYENPHRLPRKPSWSWTGKQPAANSCQQQKNRQGSTDDSKQCLAELAWAFSRIFAKCPVLRSPKARRANLTVEGLELLIARRRGQHRSPDTCSSRNGGNKKQTEGFLLTMFLFTAGVSLLGAVSLAGATKRQRAQA